MAARIQIPAAAKRGEVIEVRILIQHPMETGYRVDHVGKPVPKNAIRTLTCRYNGVEILRAAMSPGIAANPYLQFCTVAEASGELEFSWTDDAGTQESARQPIVVSG
ncbi:MAG TPA: thiosulfate oxidation carrier complex protein SoxZ [Burkholderiales bacterium]|nr:thiosulfate oxidation carrier complex protein SoxZ [Burkholderiales bacterium]